MPDESNVIPSSLLTRWLVLAALVVLGVVLYFRDGIRLPTFGSTAPEVETDSTR